MAPVSLLYQAALVFRGNSTLDLIRDAFSLVGRMILPLPLFRRYRIALGRGRIGNDGVERLLSNGHGPDSKLHFERTEAATTVVVTAGHRWENDRRRQRKSSSGLFHLRIADKV